MEIWAVTMKVSGMAIKRKLSMILRKKDSRKYKKQKEHQKGFHSLMDVWTRLLVEAGSSQPPDDEDLYAGLVVIR